MREWRKDLVAICACLAGLTCLCAFLAADAPNPALTIPCRVVSAHDGDTVSVEIRVKANVRILDCWSPELSQPGGREAAARMQRLAVGKDGLLEIPLDRADNLADVLTLGRVLGRVWVDGRDVGAVMVAEGFATREKRK